MTPSEKQAFDAMREALEKSVQSMQHAAEFRKTGLGRPPEQSCVYEIEEALSALAAADAVAEQGQPKPLGWYCVSADGMATLCVDGDDARQVAKDANSQWPRHGPHKAMQLCEYQDSAPADQFPDAGKMAAALRAIADGIVTGGESKSYFATVLAYQELARKTLETDAERMAGARAKHDDTYPGDLLARVENEPK